VCEEGASSRAVDKGNGIRHGDFSIGHDLTGIACDLDAVAANGVSNTFDMGFATVTKGS
jgi:hypothetical protein